MNTIKNQIDRMAERLIKEQRDNAGRDPGYYEAIVLTPWRNGFDDGVRALSDAFGGRHADQVAVSLYDLKVLFGGVGFKDERSSFHETSTYSRVKSIILNAERVGDGSK